MNPLYTFVAGVVLGFIAGALVARNNAKDTAAIVAAWNAAHATATTPVVK